MSLYTILNRFRLGDEKESPEYINEQVVNGIEFKGTTLIILIFAIFIASVGLNINSTAVIIGAMLISPLMGPIIGMGYSLATYDFGLFRRSVKNYSFAVATSLFASTIYFALSPLNQAHSELLARTTPTLYDVLIALFGGFAGIVATVSKKKGNVIPGAAIATALMPPLCTAGYGIATANWNYLFGSLYLFTINTVFIALSTLLFSRILKFPVHSRSSKEKIKRADRWVWIIVILTISPSIYLGYKFVVQDQFMRAATQFIKAESQLENSYLLDYEVKPAKREIILVFGGKKLSKAQKDELKKQLKLLKISDANLIIKQGFSLGDNNELNQLSKFEKYNKDIQLLKNINKTLLYENDSLQKMQKYQQEMENRIFMEMKTFYPKLRYLFIKQKDYKVDSTKKKLNYVFINEWKSRVRKKEISQWLKQRLDADSIILVIEK